jgi:serine/threonine protein kinase
LIDIGLESVEALTIAAGVRLGPYEILAFLGAGGMGEVYKARDSRLHRIVALKTLPPETVADADRKRRFLVEAQAASSLNHPNIVTIHDISEQNGVCFIAMEYVAGTTLEQANTGSGLPIKDAMKYAAEIADALAAAHEAGIIHLDLKPANIMITDDGRAKLLDFGLAKLARPVMAPGIEDVTRSTGPAAFLGTPAYMSPEQIEGRTLDCRSDIFSYGLVLYEMFSGQRAFRAETWVSILTAILHDEPRSMRNIRATIPPSLEQHVARCLRKDPAQRFQTMRDVKQALAEAASSAMTTADAHSIAVLPFVNLSADKENEYFSDGLAEEIINALTKVPDLKVIARTSAFAFRGKKQDLRAIGDRLRVETILEGSVRRAGNRIRITAQLIKVADESHLWSERYDREMTDIFAIQDDISQAIAKALTVKFAMPQRHTLNIEAFHAARAVDLYPDYWLVHFVIGLALSQKGLLQQSITSLETTVRLSPSFTLATGFLAAAYARDGQQGHAEKLMQDVMERSSRHFVSPACFGIYHAALGQADRMFEFLHAVLAERDPYLTRMDAEPYFEAFRSDARYRSLLERMNLD